VRGHIFACFLAYRVIWELRQRLHPVLERDADTQRCEAGSLVEIWRELETVSIAKLNIKDRVVFKLSQVSAYAKKLLRLCKVPTLDELLREKNFITSIESTSLNFTLRKFHCRQNNGPPAGCPRSRCQNALWGLRRTGRDPVYRPPLRENRKPTYTIGIQLCLPER